MDDSTLKDLIVYKKYFQRLIDKKMNNLQKQLQNSKEEEYVEESTLNKTHITDNNATINNDDIRSITNLLQDLFCRVEKFVRDEYQINATVILDTIKYDLVITVDEQDNITNLSVKVLNLEAFFQNEMRAWIKFCSDKNNLKLLLHITQTYNIKCRERSLLLDKMAMKQFIEVKKDYISQDGGFFLLIYHIKSRKVYCTCQWNLIFSKDLSITHHFQFENKPNENFIKKNESLLKKFNDNNDINSIQSNWNNLFLLINVNDD